MLIIQCVTQANEKLEWLILNKSQQSKVSLLNVSFADLRCHINTIIEQVSFLCFKSKE